MPKVSIIVPVYNVEKYLPKCLESIINQTFKDIEVICVNDGSTDSSPEILDSYAKKDSRIKVFNKKNGGLFSARHEGMKYITGEFTIFVDSDDWISETLVEKCLSSVENDEVDVVVFGAFSVREKKGKISCTRGGYDFAKIPDIFNRKNIFKSPPTAWSKMYRTDFIKENDIRFQEIKNGEDQLFFIHSMLCAKRIKVVRANLYYYIKSRAGAITAVNKKKSLSPIYNVYAIEKLLDDLNIEEEYKIFIISKYFKKALSWYTKSDENISTAFYNAVQELQKYLSKNYPNSWWTKFSLPEGISYWNLKWNIMKAEMFGVKK